MSSNQESSKLPQHIAIIMDGNGRWAKKRLLPRSVGHQQGVSTVRMVVEECRKKNIPYLTLFAFSTENWKRPEKEVSFLMALFEKYLKIEINNLIKNDVRLRIIGDFTELPKKVCEAFEKAEADSSHCKALTLTLAISYGARHEIVCACKKISSEVKNGSLKIEEITEQSFGNYLYAADQPDPDLLIRTSLEYRISNFLLWQLAYAELVFVDRLWPEFSREDFFKCLEDYAGRNRRFGSIQEQIEEVE